MDGRADMDAAAGGGVDGKRHAISSNATIGAKEHEPTEEELRHSVVIFYIVLIVMVVAQSALVRWRKKHQRSYDLVTLIGLWMVPAAISVQLQFWRFLAVRSCV